MKSVQIIPVGIFDVNCILIQNPESGILYITDPGGNADQIAAAARSFSYQEAVVLLTHAHVDHIAGLPDLVRLLNIGKIFLNPADQPMYRSPLNALPPYFSAVQDLPDVRWNLADPDINVISCPGHTPGGTAYLFRKYNTLLSGDTLFRESVGRTDLGGDYDTLMQTIRQNLFTLPDGLRVIPGHGPETTIAHEKQFNPYFQ